MQLFDYLQDFLLKPKLTSNQLVIFEVGDQSASCSYFFEILKKHAEQKHQLFFSDSINNYSTDLFSQKSNKNLWLNLLTNDSDEETDKKTIITNLKTLIFSGSAFVLIKKIGTKDSAYFLKIGFTIVEIDQKKFYFNEWQKHLFTILSIPLQKERLLKIERLSKNIAFDRLDDLSNFIAMLPFVSAQNLESFFNNYLELFNKESVFKLTNLLFAEKTGLTKQSTDFFKLWLKIKDDYPVQYWTSFLMNRVWAIIKTRVLAGKEANSLKKLYTDLYLADLYSKQITTSIFFESIFNKYLTNY